MRILHVVKGREKFTHTVIGLIDRHFNVLEHEVVYLSDSKNKSYIRQDYHLAQSELLLRSSKDVISIFRLIKGCRNYDYIMFHSLLLPSLLKFMVALNREILHKFVWIEFGGDLYCEKQKNLSEKLTDRLGGKCRAFVAIFPPDCDVYKARFKNANALVLYAPYIDGMQQEKWRSYLPESRLGKRAEGEKLRIQIGHSAAREVGHITVLKALQRFAAYNIELIIPLSYGDKEYADEVQKYAERLFGNKAICLRKLLPEKEYFELLGTIDIAVFNTTRQIATDNIFSLLLKNTKLYLPEESVMYRYFFESGIPVVGISELESCSFEELISPPVIEDPDRLGKFFAEYGEEKDVVGHWKDVFEQLRLIKEK